MAKNTDKYEMIDISELHPYENNARTHSDSQLEAICNSIKEFGFINPVIIDENNMILVGHGRIEASKRLGIKQAPFRRVTNLTDDQKKAYILADNKLSDLGGWDEDMLAQELESISLDMSAFGFEDFNIDIDEPEPEIAEDDFDVDGALEMESRVTRGQVWRLGEHLLMCGDSTCEADIKKLIDDTEIELVLTDAPYGIDVVQNNTIGGSKPVTIGNKESKNIVKANNYMKVKGDETTDTAKKNYEIIKDLSKNQILFGGNYFTEFLFPSRCWIVWDKENTGNFADAELAWTSFDKGVKLYHWMWNGICRKGDRETEGVKRVHPTQKPVGMLADILRDFSAEGDTVLDCFGGSGSTLLACEQTRRKCFIMEYEEHYCEVIIQRWESLTGKQAELIK